MTGHETTLPGDPPLPAFAVLPEGAKRGVVVVHEIFGRQPEIDRVVERFGGAGYAAVAPDFFAAGSRLRCVRAVMRASATGVGWPAERARDARRWLGERGGVPEAKVGLIGFCIGGGFALGVGRGWGAVSANYGVVPPKEVMEGIGPTIACYGGRDRMFRRHDAALRRALPALAVEHEVHTFPTVGHSFLTDGHHPMAAFLSRPFLHVGYDPTVAEEAWGRIFAFLERHL
jgi:carboxymethylenebutenolidase